jgi:N-acetylneuraminate synthase
MVEVVAELGINMNGSIDTTFAMIQAAADAGVDAVKMQKRIPEKDVPLSQHAKPRETPWGTMSYLSYKNRMEFGARDYRTILDYCQALSMPFFVSVWGTDSLAWMENNFPEVPRYKVPSACNQDMALLAALKATEKPIVISTGMSTIEDVKRAVDALGGGPLTICHANSTYPAPNDELNLRVIRWLQTKFPHATIGYSGHERGLATTVAAVALGAEYIERHFTLDRSMWGSDQSSSVEPGGFRRLVHDIRIVEEAMGDGIKRVMPSEVEKIQSLRGA